MQQLSAASREEAAIFPRQRTRDSKLMTPILRAPVSRLPEYPPSPKAINININFRVPGESTRGAERRNHDAGKPLGAPRQRARRAPIADLKP